MHGPYSIDILRSTMEVLGNREITEITQVDSGIGNPINNNYFCASQKYALLVPISEIPRKTASPKSKPLLCSMFPGPDKSVLAFCLGFAVRPFLRCSSSPMAPAFWSYFNPTYLAWLPAYAEDLRLLTKSVSRL